MLFQKPLKSIVFHSLIMAFLALSFNIPDAFCAAPSDETDVSKTLVYGTPEFDAAIEETRNRVAGESDLSVLFAESGYADYDEFIRNNPGIYSEDFNLSALPEELQLAVIECLDKASLGNLAQVSCAWPRLVSVTRKDEVNCWIAGHLLGDRLPLSFQQTLPVPEILGGMPRLKDLLVEGPLKSTVLVARADDPIAQIIMDREEEAGVADVDVGAPAVPAELCRFSLYKGYIFSQPNPLELLAEHAGSFEGMSRRDQMAAIQFSLSNFCLFGSEAAIQEGIQIRRATLATFVEDKLAQTRCISAEDPELARKVKFYADAPIAIVTNGLTAEVRDRLAPIFTGTEDAARLGERGTLVVNWNLPYQRLLVNNLPEGVAHLAVTNTLLNMTNRVNVFPEVQNVDLRALFELD